VAFGTTAATGASGAAASGAALAIGMVMAVPQARHLVAFPATASGTEYPFPQPGQLKVIGMVQQPR
jgi:hypothetical protein